MITNLTMIDWVDPLLDIDGLLIGLTGIAGMAMYAYERKMGRKAFRLSFVLIKSLLVICGTILAYCFIQSFLLDHQYRAIFGRPVPHTYDERAIARQEVIEALMNHRMAFLEMERSYDAKLMKLASIDRSTAAGIAAYVDYKESEVDWERDRIENKLEYLRRLRAAIYAAGFKDEVRAVSLEGR